MRKIVHGTSPNLDKQIAIFENDGTDVKYYSIEDGYFTLTPEERAQIRKFPRSAKYMLIKKNGKCHIMKDLTLKQQCKKITKDAKLLIEITKGKINLHRTGSVAKTSLQLFYDLCSPPEPEQIQPFEIDILESGRGQLIWGNKYDGKAYKYDIASQYPSLMASAQHKYPIGEGTLKTFTKKEFKELKYYTFGMYHVNVLNSDSRIFVYNLAKWYTDTDLNFAKDLGYKITLIDDNEPNALLFNSKALMTGRELFGPFVKFLFKLKKKGHTEIKEYLDALWGALTQVNIMKVSDVIHEGKEILTITPKKGGGLIVETVVKDKYYETNFARIKPFLLSYGRVMIAKIINKKIDSVVRCHTDGIICTKEITNIELGNDFGNLKYEGAGNCIIKNSNSYSFKNT